MQREKLTSTRSIVEMQLIQIFIPTKEVLNLILDAFKEVQLAHHLLPFPCLPVDLWKTGCSCDAAFFVFPAAEITLQYRQLQYLHRSII